ncbi:uncharacterized protein CLUP02_15230 [Colletotrichum lupini]|uniref:Uncharacterized protein n=1 Tax=Colletotrichum lupini TaxID=145971 RepID=A0A9Q8T5K0_9PEZI|nr:uncharacterized protein CLUP02_15230 [Colletotrichum lupini]UQC89699.1 hypothetical protein CLUP02_15230 [Colletotrichum lupini]
MPGYPLLPGGQSQMSQPSDPRLKGDMGLATPFKPLVIAPVANGRPGYRSLVPGRWNLAPLRWLDGFGFKGPHKVPCTTDPVGAVSRRPPTQHNVQSCLKHHLPPVTFTRSALKLPIPKDTNDSQATKTLKESPSWRLLFCPLPLATEYGYLVLATLRALPLWSSSHPTLLGSSSFSSQIHQLATTPRAVCWLDEKAAPDHNIR